MGDQINTNHINWLSKKLSLSSGHHGQIWGDEANWTKFHAASWNALRNNSWTNMGFSPSVIASRNYFTQENFGSKFNENEFIAATSAYTALIDMLTLGGIWSNPKLTFDFFHEYENKHALSPQFIRFWLPMINQLMAWTNNSHALDNAHDFDSHRIQNPFDLELKNMTMI